MLILIESLNKNSENIYFCFEKCIKINKVIVDEKLEIRSNPETMISV